MNYKMTNLRITRIKAGLTQWQLRDMAKVGINTIVELEKDNIDGITLGTLKKIAKALNTSVKELFLSDEE